MPPYPAGPCSELVLSVHLRIAASLSLLLGGWDEEVHLHSSLAYLHLKPCLYMPKIGH